MNPTSRYELQIPSRNLGPRWLRCAFIPDIDGLHDVAFHTSDTIMRIDRLPRRLVIIGGGFVATELGYVFASLGSEVTIVNRSPTLLVAEDRDVSERFTAVAGSMFELILGAKVRTVGRVADGIAVHLSTAGGPRSLVGDVLLVATGRRPNGDQLAAETAGIEVASGGHVIVDGHGRTTAPGVWALGDVNGRYQLKHMANGEAAVIGHNLLHPDDLRPLDRRPAPHAVFSSPQIGSIGPTEDHARAAGRPICVITQPYSSAAYGWALEDTTSFAKLIGDPLTRTLVGAHIVGYQASMLVQLLVQGIHLGSTVDEMACGQVWIHPALSEVVEQALIALAEEFDRYDEHGAQGRDT